MTIYAQGRNDKNQCGFKSRPNERGEIKLFKDSPKLKHFENDTNQSKLSFYLCLTQQKVKFILGEVEQFRTRKYLSVWVFIKP